jgi:aerotaxis receptor
MKVNLPVTQQEFELDAHDVLVSTTDTQGRITHCNEAFFKVSGYSYDELYGQPHNMIRHPDMPPEAFKDLWTTIGRGRPWSGIVKNRRKNGDHYWVEAHVTPIMEGGKPRSYMSVRIKPSRTQIQAAEALYDKIRQQRESGRAPTFELHAGAVRRLGWRAKLGLLGRLSVSQQLGMALFFMVAGVAFARWRHFPPWLELGLLVVSALAVLGWFRYRFSGAFDDATRFAGDLASCDLTTAPATSAHANCPAIALNRQLYQIQLNLRAVVNDVSTEVNKVAVMIAEVARGSADLSARTEAQASSLQETAASMEQLSSTVRQTADTARQVSQQSDQSTEVAERGGQAVQRVGTAMLSIEQSSRKVSEIISVIEGIAFQTNILALNAAVEAARAGEQGRGFAVVASEVRNLAQRSAEAAKEIRDLIGASVSQVEQGSQEMQSAGSTIADVVEAVGRVSHLIRQITSATTEQSSGISQINEAVTQLDSTTQQNAALVEETAASTEALNRSAVTLTRAVQVFKV